MINTNKITIAMSTELINHLKNLNNNSLIGLCIQQILLKDEELRMLLKEFKNISRENPEIIIPIVGKEAYSLLME